MKDLPHHLKKLNRRIVRSIRHEMMEDENFDQTMPAPPLWKPTARQLKKQAKSKQRKQREARVPTHLTPEERNQKMKHRVPIFDRTSHPRPKIAKPTRKKTPRI